MRCIVYIPCNPNQNIVICVPFYRRDFEERLKIEQESHADAVAKLTKLQEKYVVEKKKIKGDLEEKQNIIKELSQKLEVHQQDFDTLKRELTQV